MTSNTFDLINRFINLLPKYKSLAGIPELPQMKEINWLEFEKLDYTIQWAALITDNMGPPV